MATTIHTHNTGQLERFTSNLWQHQQKNQLCDFTFTTNKASIKCHKLVLASASSYFSQTFCNSKYRFNIIDVSPLPEHVLRTAVAFMYNSAYVIDDENVVALLKLSESWNLDIFITLCASYINNNFTIDNACRLYSFTLAYYSMSEFQQINKFIREHFKSLHESNKLRQISLKNYIDIIDHDEINVDNEDVIFSNAVQIIEQQTSVSSVRDTHRCLELIRYPHISSDYLIDVVQVHHLMKQPPQNRYVREALKYHVNKSSTQTVRPPRTWNVGTCTYYIAHNKYVYRYETKDGKDTCTKIVDLNKPWVPVANAVALHERRKCAIVFDSNGKVNLFDITNNKNEPRTLACLPVEVDASGIALSENSVYILGGQCSIAGCLDSLFHVSFDDNGWQKKKSMPHALTYPLAIQHQMFIYVLGGRLNNDEQQASVSKYNIRLDAWERCSDMPTSCDSFHASVVVHDSNIKVITKDILLIYSDNTDTWSAKHFTPCFDWIRVFVKREQICAAVSESNTMKLFHRVLCYDDVMNEWKTEKTIYDWLHVRDVCIETIPQLFF